ncbi:TolC family protein [Aquimarina sp. MMG015]|uniref:TolC family protein n=1 Tax=unclassified Aquimarina TaxID=2627091 RepID=UPI0011C4880F|nr:MULTISPECIES: TolC family protein [unclassified Aquimarina]MBQ4802826.1 TolC family protein [Aquimarina sp. MMG015]
MNTINILNKRNSHFYFFTSLFEVKKGAILSFFIFFLNITSAQTLQEYIREAKENNPELKAAQNVLDVSLEKVHEVGGLPNTTIGTGYFVSEPETRTGAQKARFNVQQNIPWFGTIKARKETASTESEVNKNELEIAKRKITLLVEQTYYRLYELKARQKILVEQNKLLDTYIEIALKEVENNRASTVDVLKFNIAKNNLQNEEEILKGKILTAETAMNQLLHRDGFDPLVVPDNLFIPEEEPTMILDDITYHPELMTYDHLGDLLDKKESVNAKESLPSIGIGLDYVIVEERPNISFSDNGKDIVMPKISLSVPLFSKKHKSRSKQYELQKEEVYQKREASQNNLENMMEEAINNRITARINYDTQQKNIMQAKQAEEIILSAYQTTQLNFEDVLDVQQMLLDFENKKIEAIAMYFMQTAVLNYLR